MITSPFPIAPHSKIVCIGDSLTKLGRDMETGELTPWNPEAGLGVGWVAMLQALLQAQAPELNLRFVNRGEDGHQVHDLAKRWQTDVLDLAPDWLFVAIGTNDVWRQFDSPFRSELHHSREDFRRVYTELLAQTRPSLQGLVLVAPFVVERDPQDTLRQAMHAHAEVTRELAEAFDATFIPTQPAIDRITEHIHPTSLAWDRIHPGPAGHMAVALEILKELGGSTLHAHDTP